MANWISDLWNDYYETGIIPNIWKGITGQTSADRNADNNLEYQRERAAIEDARYEEETAYNRAFAEDERDYNRAFAEDERAYNRAFAENQRSYERALQQQIFEREDTALERQASQLSSMGINPLSQQMNGLGSGSVVSPGGSPSSHSALGASAPSASSRGGSPLHDDRQILDTLAPMLELANGLSNINTQGLQRDSIRSEINRQRLENQKIAIENAILANKNDVTINDDGTITLNKDFKHKEQDFEEVRYEDSNASKNRNVREDTFQEKFGVTDNTNTYVRLATDTANQGERAINYVNNKKSIGQKALDVMATSANKAINWMSNAWENDKRRWNNFLNKKNNSRSAVIGRMR